MNIEWDHRLETVTNGFNHVTLDNVKLACLGAFDTCLVSTQVHIICGCSLVHTFDKLFPSVRRLLSASRKDVTAEMSEGRTPTATLTEQRRLEQEDVDILHQIVIRAQNDPASKEQPKDALWQAYVEIFDERKLSHQHDRACFNVLLKLLNPSTPGESLYHKFENILQEDGIVLAYDDDATTQDGLVSRHHEDSDAVTDDIPLSGSALQTIERPQHNTIHALDISENIHEVSNDAYFDNVPIHISHLLYQAEARDRLVLTRQTIEAWRGALQAAKDRHLEKRADALYELRLKRKVLKQYIAVFQDLNESQTQADQIYQHRLTKHALSITSDEYRVRRMNSIDEDRVKAVSLYTWTLAARESTFKRNKVWQSKRFFLQKLINSYRAIQANEANLEGLLHQNNLQVHSSILQSSMAMLIQRQKVVSEQNIRAVEQNRNVLYQASLKTWQSEFKKVADLSLTAEDAREYFLMKRVLRQLRSMTQFRVERRKWLATWTLRKWNVLVKHRKHARYDETYRQIRKTVKMNLARKLLRCWQQKLSDLNQHEARADGMYHASLMKRISKPVVETLYDKTEWVARNEPLADSTSDRLLTQRAIIAVQMRQQSLLDMSVRAERLHQYRVEQQGVHSLRQMQLRAFELQRRQYDADAFRERHDKRVVRNMLARFRHVLAGRQAGDEGTLNLGPPPAVTPARKREELLFYSTTRLSSTPAYTPFAMRLRQESKVLEDIDSENPEEEEEVEIGNDTFADAAEADMDFENR